MTDFDSNPFADPEAANPFQDPSVQQATSNSSRGLEEFNPFEERNTQTNSKTTPIVSQPTQPAVMKPTTDQSAPPAYTVSAAQPAPPPGQEDILRRQEELERKAAELQRREQQMQATQYNTRVNNWPPLPSFCPVKPCFYQDFSVDIPLEFQRTVKMGYFIWIMYVILLFLNVIVSLSYLASGYGGDSGIAFGLSIVFFMLWSMCSFICWYRPLYKAFRSDSSFSFFMFFFIFAVQLICTIVQAIGIDQWGSSGWINGLTVIGGSQSVGRTAVGVMMLIMGLLFSLLAVIMVFYIKKVHSLYRRTGASFQKAQQEFAQGVVTNPTVQSAAKDAGKAAAAGAADAAVSGAISSVASQNNTM